MRIGNSSNPALSRTRLESVFASATSSERMTVEGAINKTALMLVLLVLAGAYVWNLASSGANVMPWLIGGTIGGLVLALATIFKPEWSPYTAPVYAVAEGLALGAISALYNSVFGGIVLQAVGLTVAILFMMLFLYKTGIIKATPKFKRGVLIATGGVALFYVLNMVAGMFGGGVSLMGMGLLGIGIQLAIVVIAALNLVMDFDFIETAANEGAPKLMEWMGAFGLMVTLVWLYLEILRLLSLLASGD